MTTQLEPSTRVVVTVLGSALLPGPTTQTVALPFGSRDTAACGTRIARGSIDWLNTARTNMPGSSSPFGLAKRARSVIVPVAGSTTASANSTLPVRPYSSPSSSFSRTTARVGTAPPVARPRRSASSAADDCWMST